MGEPPRPGPAPASPRRPLPHSPAARPPGLHRPPPADPESHHPAVLLPYLGGGRCSGTPALAQGHPACCADRPGRLSGPPSQGPGHDCSASRFLVPPLANSRGVLALKFVLSPAGGSVCAEQVGRAGLGKTLRLALAGPEWRTCFPFRWGSPLTPFQEGMERLVLRLPGTVWKSLSLGGPPQWRAGEDIDTRLVYSLLGALHLPQCLAHSRRGLSGPPSYGKRERTLTRN